MITLVDLIREVTPELLDIGKFNPADHNINATVEGLDSFYGAFIGIQANQLIDESDGLCFLASSLDEDRWIDVLRVLVEVFLPSLSPELDAMPSIDHMVIDRGS